MSNKPGGVERAPLPLMELAVAVMLFIVAPASIGGPTESGDRLRAAGRTFELASHQRQTAIETIGAASAAPISHTSATGRAALAGAGCGWACGLEPLQLPQGL